MDWNWQVIFDHIPDLQGGAVLTIQLVVISGIVGLFFGLILALLRLSKRTRRLVVYPIPCNWTLGHRAWMRDRSRFEP